MTPATTSGCESIAKWEAPSTSVTVEPARPSEKRCSSGAIGWSPVPNTPQDGFVRQAAAAAASSNAVATSGRCACAMNAATSSGTSAQKMFWKRSGLEEVPHRERREAALQVGDRLADVGHESGDIHERGDLVRGARDRDHAAGIRVAYEDDGAVELGDDSFEIGDVGGDAAQGKRSSEQRVLAAVEEVVDAAPARGVSERAMDENDGWLGHANSFRVRMKS